MKYSFNSFWQNVVALIRTEIGRERQDWHPGKAIADRDKFPFEFARDRAMRGGTAQKGVDFNEDPGLGRRDKGIAEGLAFHDRMLDIGFENGGCGHGKSN